MTPRSRMLWVEADLEVLLNKVKAALTEDDIFDVKEYLEVGEYSLALDAILDGLRTVK